MFSLELGSTRAGFSQVVGRCHVLFVLRAWYLLTGYSGAWMVDGFTGDRRSRRDVAS